MDDLLWRFGAFLLGGGIIRSRQYFVSGVLTVDEDGGNPRFAREEANENYRDVEFLMDVIDVTEQILDDLLQ